ncbi:hypothetical protein [Paenibacillus sp. RC73]|uniref:hypothetical protein n=1 Tax=Paenibacillus sp. RC73 TaxID=3156250 RepID=UPI003850141C
MMLIVLLVNVPGLAAAAAPPTGNIKVPSGGFEVIVPKDTSGTFPAKTSGGGSKFVPTEGGGKYYIASIRMRVKGALSDKVYVTVTFGDGYRMKINKSIDGSPVDIGPTAFRAHKSKGISISIHSDGSAEKFVKLAEYGFLPEAEQDKSQDPPIKAVEGKQRPHRQKVAMVAPGAAPVAAGTQVQPTLAAATRAAVMMAVEIQAKTLAAVSLPAASVTLAKR